MNISPDAVPAPASGGGAGGGPGARCCPPLLAGGLTDVAAAELAELLKALASPVRLRLMSIVASTAPGGICVCHLGAYFAISAPTLSYHLKIMRERGLLVAERRGNEIYYRARLDVLERLAPVFGPAPGAVTAHPGDPA